MMQHSTYILASGIMMEVTPFGDDIICFLCLPQMPVDGGAMRVASPLSFSHPRLFQYLENSTQMLFSWESLMQVFCKHRLHLQVPIFRNVTISLIPNFTVFNGWFSCLFVCFFGSFVRSSIHSFYMEQVFLCFLAIWIIHWLSKCLLCHFLLASFMLNFVWSVVSCGQAMWCNGSDISLGNERIRSKLTPSHGDFGQETQFTTQDCCENKTEAERVIEATIYSWNKSEEEI